MNASIRVGLADISISGCVAAGKKGSEYIKIGNTLLHIFNGYGIPIIALLGTIGNILSLVVLLQPQMRKSSMNIGLIGLSSCDLLFVVSIFFYRCVTQQWVKFLSDVNLRLSLHGWFKAIFFPLVKIGWMGSHLFTVLITIERYIAVCHPLKAAFLCTRRKAIISSLGIITFSIIFAGPIILSRLDPPISCSVRIAYKYYVTYGYCIVGNLIPFVVLAVFNTLIYREIRRSKSIQLSIQSYSSTTKNTETASLAFLLFGIVITFVVCELFQLATDTLYLVVDLRHTMFYRIILSPRHFMGTLNSCVNFIFYCVFGKKFRTQLYKLFPKIFSKVDKNRRKSEITEISSKDDDGHQTSQTTINSTNV